MSLGGFFIFNAICDIIRDFWNNLGEIVAMATSRDTAKWFWIIVISCLIIVPAIICLLFWLIFL